MSKPRVLLKSAYEGGQFIIYWIKQDGQIDLSRSRVALDRADQLITSNEMAREAREEGYIVKQFETDGFAHNDEYAWLRSGK